MYKDLKHKLLIIEDQEVLREGMKKTFKKIFTEVKKDKNLKPYVPSSIKSYENLSQLLNLEKPNKKTFYSWITDWHVGDDPNEYLSTTSAVYTGLASLLGKYKSIIYYDGYIDKGETELLLDEFENLKQVGEENLTNLYKLLNNTGALFIHTAFPGEALFHKDVATVFEDVGKNNSPLVLYQEKSVNIDKDIKQLAAGTIFAARSYEGKLPIIGESKTEDIRSNLKNSIASDYNLSRKISDNRLEDFLDDVMKR